MGTSTYAGAGILACLLPLLEHPSSTRPTSAPNSDPNESPAKT